MELNFEGSFQKLWPKISLRLLSHLIFTSVSKCWQHLLCSWRSALKRYGSFLLKSMQLLKFSNIQNKLNEYQRNIHKWNILFFRKLETPFDRLLMRMLTNQVSHYLISTGTNVFCLWSWCKEECRAQSVQSWKKVFLFCKDLICPSCSVPSWYKGLSVRKRIVLRARHMECGDCKHPGWWERLMPGEDPALRAYPHWEQTLSRPQPSLWTFSMASSCTWLRQSEQGHWKAADPAHCNGRL